jgi:hypothetical protein
LFPPAGPTVRIVCRCGKRLHVGTGTGPAGWRDDGAAVFTWSCPRCGERWEIPAAGVVDAWIAARERPDRTIRLPLA